MAVICVLNRSRLDDADVAFFTAAVDAQLREDFVPAWAGVDYTPATFFASADDLPVASGIARLMIIQDTIDTPGAAGYHDFEGVPRSVILAQGQQTSVTMSHEACEMTADPNADKWVRQPDGSDVALEVADPCESDTYAKLVTILGADRYVLVSNFVLPSWFQPAGSGPFDRLGTISQALDLAPGGYKIIQGADGKVSDVWGSEEARAARRLAKVANSTTRSYRRGLRL
jgi:hypothetical protein